MPSGVIQELRTVVFGRASLADGILPPIVFAVADATAGTVTAAVLAVITGLAIVTVRLRSGRPVKFALAGLGGVTVAAVAALGLGPGGFFLPSVVSGAGLTMLIIISIGFGRPFVAWTSWLARSWPLAWYWHPRVRPAYTFVSWIWAAFFGLRTVGQWLTLESTSTAALYRVSTGWPALLLLLVATYVIGRRRLERLGGPSIDEFREGTPEPWAGQQTGF